MISPYASCTAAKAHSDASLNVTPSLNLRMSRWRYNEGRDACTVRE